MKFRWLIGIALLILPSCGTIEQWLFGSPTKREDQDIEKSNRKLTFVIPSSLDIQTFSKTLADYAVACWIMGDPTYMLQPPKPRGDGGVQLSLITKEGGTTTEALRIIITNIPANGTYQVVGYGPLAHPQYEEPLLRGVHRAAVSKTECE